MSRKNENKKAPTAPVLSERSQPLATAKNIPYWQGALYRGGTTLVPANRSSASITGKTQKEVAQKLRQITAEIDAKTYVAPCKLSISEWMSIWAQDHLVGVKASTAYLYRRTIELYIEPHLAHIRLGRTECSRGAALLQRACKPSKPDAALSPQSPSRTFTACCKGAEAGCSDWLPSHNPTEACILPRIIRKEMHPLEEDQVAVFLREVQGIRTNTL